jgi:hypothetical protein
MVDADGDFVGEVCHIEAAEPGGERFNASMTPQQRRAASNLILLCSNHHRKTNNVAKFPVAVLKEMKQRHEARFASIAEKMARSLSDATDNEVAQGVKSLERMAKLLGWDKLEPEDLALMVEQVNEYSARLQDVPEPTRQFLAAVVKRNYKMRKTRAVDNSMGVLRTSLSDLENALNLSARRLTQYGDELEQYRLGGIDEHEPYGPMRHVMVIRSLDGWGFWQDIAEFSERTGVPLETFWKDLDFRSLDAEH